MKLKTLFAAAAVVLAAACSTDSPTASIVIGPPPALPAGADTITTASGLKYVNISVGTGEVAQAGDVVQVHYTAWLIDGTGFDTSRGRGPLQFTLGTDDVIPGFDEGVTGMLVGGNRRLIVPPALAYGSNPVRDPQSGQIIIPANSTIIFDVELVSAQ